MNRFSIKPFHTYSTNNHNHMNPFRIKRTYNTMLEQDHSIPSPGIINPRRQKINEGKPAEPLVKSNRARIPEKLKREIELYNYEKRGYNIKIKPCSCEN